MRKHVSFLLLLMMLTWGIFPVLGQSAGSVQIRSIQTEAFPTVTLTFDAFDSSGQFPLEMSTTQASVHENGQPRPVETLTLLEPGVHFTVAINPGAAFNRRDARGITRYQKIAETLQDWAATQPSTSQDTLSLFTPEEALLSNDTPAAWLTAFTQYKPNINGSTPNVQALSLAIDAAQNQTAAHEQKRVILFLTPHLDQNAQIPLDNLRARAKESGIQIHIWMIDSSAYIDHSSATAFQKLASETGGTFSLFTGQENSLSPEPYLVPFRFSYQLTYISRLSSAGVHEISLTVDMGGSQLTSPVKTASFDIQPPNPILVSPPMQIVRQSPPEQKYDASALEPREQAINLMVEFPDGHPRAITSTILYVDNLAVAENLSEPFGTFVWDISAYNVSTTVSIMVEVEDELGLSAVSMVMPVQITVVEPPSGVAAMLDQYSLWLTAVIIGLGGLALLGILITGARRIKAGQLFSHRQARQKYMDPVTQPVDISQTEPTDKQKKGKFLWGFGASQKTAAPAYLVRINEYGEPVTSKPISLNLKETTFGTDPVQSLHVLDDPSISGLHARLKQQEDGTFWLYDQNSIAGTWVNYELIPQGGCALKHGDMIHFGKLVYRFNVHDAPKANKPKRITQSP